MSYIEKLGHTAASTFAGLGFYTYGTLIEVTPMLNLCLSLAFASLTGMLFQSYSDAFAVLEHRLDEDGEEEDNR